MCSKHAQAYNKRNIKIFCALSWLTAKIIFTVSAIVSVVKAQDASLQGSEVAQDS